VQDWRLDQLERESAMFALRWLGAVSIALACAYAPLAVAQAQQQRLLREQALPADVRTFIERRDACDHFRGEAASDPARAREIARELDYYCTGTDAELARLKRIHARDRSVRRALADYDIRIEQPKAPAR
jgi:hypothetical protein